MTACLPHLTKDVPSCTDRKCDFLTTAIVCSQWYEGHLQQQVLHGNVANIAESLLLLRAEPSISLGLVLRLEGNSLHLIHRIGLDAKELVDPLEDDKKAFWFTHMLDSRDEPRLFGCSMQ